MKQSIYIITIIVFIISSACEKQEAKKQNEWIDLEEKTYYKSEIINAENIDLYGDWKLYAVSGGFAGIGHDLNFDYLSFKSYGIYGFSLNDSIKEYGKIEISSQTNSEFEITFVPEEKSEILMHDNVKNIVFYGSDTLSLNSPCCDRYNYHLVRVK